MKYMVLYERGGAMSMLAVEAVNPNVAISVAIAEGGVSRSEIWEVVPVDADHVVLARMTAIDVLCGRTITVPCEFKDDKLAELLGSH